MIQVEVGDMPKDQIGAYLQRIKTLIEQKAAFNAGQSMAEYTNPGPVENNVYFPVHDGKGAITTNEIGGDVDVKGLADLDYFNNKLFSAVRVPKQFLGFTDDAAGFSGGSSLAIISSRYGKAVKRIQNSFIQALTDVINLFLLDKGLDNYVNKFTLRMQAPVTQEEIDRRENADNRVRYVGSVMSEINNIVDDNALKLKVLKSMLASTINNPEVLNLLETEIERLEGEAGDTQVEKEEKRKSPEKEMNDEEGFKEREFNPILDGPEEESEEESEKEPNLGVDTAVDFNLPTPEEVNVDVDTQAEESFRDISDLTTLNEGEELSLPTFEDLGVDGTKY